MVNSNLRLYYKWQFERLNRMAIANMKVILNEDIKKVWEVVTALYNYAWRSDLNKIEVLESGKKFIEYTREGYATTFTNN